MTDDYRNDVLTMREYLLNALKASDQLKAVAEGAPMSLPSMQQTLEIVSGQFEYAVLEMRKICDRYAPGIGGYPRKRLIRTEHPTGDVVLVDGRWVQITLNTLLPHCRYQSPAWLADTIRRMLDEYEHEHGRLPCFPKAVLVIEESCAIGGRHIFDQDNKGWKAVSNAIKGRLIPDDDQFSLGLVLLSVFSEKTRCRITLLPAEDAAEYLLRRKEGLQI